MSERKAALNYLRSNGLKPIHTNTVTPNRVFSRLAALFVVAIARYDSSSRLASRKNPSISLSRY
jgi:hypothetical protein